MRTIAIAVLLTLGLALGSCKAQEAPYFVTYSQHMEEPGNLEIETFGVASNPHTGNPFLGGNIEFEYGLSGWWTTEFYLDGQVTRHDSTIFTGFRWENRFRPLMREHWINPVLYAEFEDTSADKALREVVGHDGKNDFAEPNYSAREVKEREFELKLILGSNFHGWNLSENFIAEKNVSEGEPWEFGYALGISRPLKLEASAHDCTFCLEKFQAGAEMYGGLGDTEGFGTRLTSHYLGPTLNWQSPHNFTFSFSPQFGLNNYSIPVLYRFGISYEINQLFSHFHR